MSTSENYAPQQTAVPQPQYAPYGYQQPMPGARVTGWDVMVGTSGWQYRDWRGPFYPPKLPQRLWLEHYTGNS